MRCLRRISTRCTRCLSGGQFDTLAHITYPLRYVCKPGERPSFARYAQQLDRIFKKLIETGQRRSSSTPRAFCAPDAPVLPDREIFSRYHALGGRARVTLGAEAHYARRTSRGGIPEALDMLREIGYTEYTVLPAAGRSRFRIEYIPKKGVTEMDKKMESSSAFCRTTQS